MAGNDTIEVKNTRGQSIQIAPQLLPEAIQKGWSPSALPEGKLSATPSLSAVQGRPAEAEKAIKSFGYTQAAHAKDLTVNNMDTLLGILGGLLGTTGGPVGAVAGSALGGGAGRALQQIEGFSRGKAQPSSLAAASDIGTAAAEQGGAEAGGALLGRVFKAISPASKIESLSFASGAGSGAVADIPAALQKVIPDLDKSVKMAGGKLETVGQFQKVIDVTSKRLDSEFNLALQPIAGQTMVPDQVAAAIRGKITPAMMKTPEGRAAASYLQKKATQFESEWTIQELNDERMRVTTRLKSYHNAAPSTAAAKTRLDSAIAADQATEKVLKEIIYDAADKAGGKTSGYFRNLKVRQSALIDLQDQMAKQSERLSNATASGEGAPLRQKVHVGGYLHTSGLPTGVMRGTPSLFSSPQSLADNAIRRAYPSTGRKALSYARSITKPLANRDIAALPIRYLFTDSQ